MRFLQLRAAAPGRAPVMATLAMSLLLGGCGKTQDAASSASAQATTAAPAAAQAGSAGIAAASTAPGATQAARFLTQATFGPRADEIAALQKSSYAAWLDTQFSTPATLQLPRLKLTRDRHDRGNRMQLWWKTAVTGNDQLRQRVAFAFSEIFVVSDQSAALSGQADAIAYFHDVLAQDAFGNFRTLLEDVTLSPAMGLYLNMLGSRKPDPDNNIHADENYAREVMQLFTIGLVQLAADGSVRLDGNGKPIPTYTQSDVTNLARALTGWSWKGSDFYGPANNTAQMVPFADYHDTDAKTLIGGVQIAAGGDARSELKTALDTLFAHPNVGPFIARQLIQRLVTSNPSPAYVGRVAAVFNDNGSGVRGDLRAVTRAILLDSEARDDAYVAQASYGKRREPVLCVTQLWRSFNGAARNRRYDYAYPEYDLNQAPFGAPSVFNFFKPDYAPEGDVRNSGLVAPEFQLANASSVTRYSNFISTHTYAHQSTNLKAAFSEVLLDISDLKPLARASDTGALVDQLSLRLMSGQMNSAMRSALVADLNSVDAGDGGANRVMEGIFLTMTSPQYLVQK